MGLPYLDNWNISTRFGLTAIVVCVFALMNSASASTLDLQKALAEFQQAKTCCVSLADLRVEQHDWTRAQDISVGSESGVFPFADSGASYYRAFELPQTNGDYAITIESELMGNAVVIVTSQSCFYPIVTLLDANKKPLSETTMDSIQFDPGGFRPGFVRVVVPIKASQDAKYIVIHTPQRAIGAEMSFPVKQKSPAGPLGGLLFNIPDTTRMVSYPGAPVSNGSITMSLGQTGNQTR
jgi:hypothetical protein